MKRFFLPYLGMTTLLFLVFYWELSPISTVINQLQTDIVINLTSLTLPDNIMQEYEIIINRHYRLVIEKACNGMVPYLFFLASIIVFPSTIKDKIKWGVIGYIAITAVNILRIWLVTQFVLEEVGNFSLAHDFVGNFMLIFMGLVLFVLFVRGRG